jgi:hypothetical protein
MMWDDDLTPGESGFWQEPDYFLADLISGFVNRGGMQLGLTLFLHGTIITGTLISEQEYLNAMSDMFTGRAKQAMVRPSVEELKATNEAFDFTGLAEDIDAPELDDDEDENDFSEPKYPTIRFLHLKDPVILQPHSSISFSHTPVSILRIRLTEIDGWMIGKVAVEDDMDDDEPYLPQNQVRH